MLEPPEELLADPLVEDPPPLELLVLDPPELVAPPEVETAETQCPSMSQIWPVAQLPTWQFGMQVPLEPQTIWVTSPHWASFAGVGGFDGLQDLVGADTQTPPSLQMPPAQQSDGTLQAYPLSGALQAQTDVPPSWGFGHQSLEQSQLWVQGPSTGTSPEQPASATVGPPSPAGFTPPSVVMPGAPASGDNAQRLLVGSQ